MDKKDRDTNNSESTDPSSMSSSEFEERLFEKLESVEWPMSPDRPLPDSLDEFFRILGIEPLDDEEE